MSTASDVAPPSGDADGTEAGSNTNNTLLAEYIATTANLRRERRKLEKDLAAVRKAHEDLLFQCHDRTERGMNKTGESCDDDRVLHMQLELHKNQVTCRRPSSWLCCVTGERVATIIVVSYTPKFRAESWYFQRGASLLSPGKSSMHCKIKCKKNHRFVKKKRSKVSFQWRQQRLSWRYLTLPGLHASTFYGRQDIYHATSASGTQKWWHSE